MHIDWETIKLVTGGEWVRPPAAADPRGVTDVTDDSRTVCEGALFVAIRGTITDGHMYVDQVRANGAAAVIVEVARAEEFAGFDRPCLAVKSPLQAYLELARAWRRSFHELTVIGITGTSGKTSVRAILGSVLEQVFPGAILATEGNTNNMFGVPRNLFRLRPHHRAAVLELGSSHPGEIARLASTVEPEIGVITSIGKGHLEFLGDVAGVAEEKAALLAALPPDGVAVIPDSCPEHARLLQAAGDRGIRRFGMSATADVRVECLGPTPDGGSRIGLTWRDTGDRRTVDWPLGGRHQALNAAAAAATAAVLDISPDQVVAGLSRVRLPNMRMQFEERNGVHWVNDAYNANPDSMRAALEWFAEVAAAHCRGRAVAVLGDMFELGETAPREHRELLEWARTRMPEAEILAVGELMAEAAHELDLQHCGDAGQARVILEEMVRPGDCVLLKASRGMRLEGILDR